MLNRDKLIEAISDAIVAVFEQGMDDDEHFRTSLANSYNLEQLSEISQEDVKNGLIHAKSELLDLTLIMIDELINKK